MENVNQVRFELSIVRNFYRYLDVDLRGVSQYRDLVDRYDQAASRLDPVLFRLYDVMYHKGASLDSVSDQFNCARRTVSRYHSEMLVALAATLAV